MEDEKQNSQSPVLSDEIQTGLMHKYKKKYKKGGRYCIVKQKQTSYDKLTADLEIPTKLFQNKLGGTLPTRRKMRMIKTTKSEANLEIPAK